MQPRSPIFRTAAPALAWLIALAVVGPSPASAQEFPRPNVADIESRLADTVALEGLSPVERATTESDYRLALDALRLAEEWDGKGLEFSKLDAESPERLARFRAELVSPLPPLPEVGPAASAAELIQGRTLAEGSLTAARELIEKLRGETSSRTERRTSLPGHTARLRQQLSGLDDSLRQVELSERDPAHAQRTRLLAQRAALAAEISAGERELASYDARQELLLVRRDRAQRKLTLAERDLEFWQRKVDEERRKAAEKASEEAERQRLEALSRPRLKQLAEGNKALAETRTREGGLVDRIERVSSDLAEASRSLDDVRTSFRALRRRERAAGLTEGMGVILRHRYGELFDAFTLRRAVWTAQSELAQAELATIEFEELREGAGDVEAALSLLEGASGFDPLTRRVAADLLVARRGLLDAALTDSQRLSQLLAELDLVRRELEQAQGEMREYIEERILWVGSAQGSLIPSPGMVRQAFYWAFSGQAWWDAAGAVGGHLLRTPSDLTSLALGLLLVLGGWVLARNRLSAPPTRVSIALTFRKLLRVLLLAGPAPAAVFGLGWLLARPPGQVEQAVAMGAALRHLGIVIYVGLAGYGLLQQKGVGSDLRWPSTARAHLRWHLLWLIPLKASCAAIRVGLEAQSHSEWSDAFGRLAFCIGELGLAAFMILALRRAGPVYQAMREREPNGLTLRLRPLWFTLAVGTPLALAVFCAWGYAYTAAKIEGRLLASFLVVVAALLTYGLLVRWLLLARRAVASQLHTAASGAQAASAAAAVQVAERPEASTQPAPEPVSVVPAAPAPEPATGVPASGRADVVNRDPESSAKLERESEALDLAAIRQRSGRLFRSLVLVAMLCAFWLIWDDVLPALNRLEQVQLWPTVDWVVAEEQSYSALEQTSSLARQEVISAVDEPTPAPSMQPLMPTASTTPSEAEPAAQTRVTLVNLGAALIVLVVTVLLGTNLPGLLELALLQRLPLDAGARYALITVTRYVVVFIGVTVACKNLGITWSSIQWLAAALTFGLAFGLQEIFANFVSGLILLAERPIRVGDVVTVGAVNGRITRIRIRATTIQQWNGKELVIPNKNFVTGEVVNWTLSNPQLRLEIPVGLAYGTDVQRARDRMLALADAHPDVLHDPEPTAVYLGFGASSLDVELRVWIADPSFMPPVRGDLLKAIQADFKEGEIEIAFPQRDLHLRSGTLDVRMVDSPAQPTPGTETA